MWKNPLIYALAAIFPLGGAMSQEIPTILAVSQDEAHSAVSRINRHIMQVRENLLDEDNSEVLYQYDLLTDEVKTFYLQNKKLKEGDIHQILEAVAFTHAKKAKTASALKDARYHLDHHDKDQIIAWILKPTLSQDTPIKEIRQSFGVNVANIISQK